MLKQCVYSFLLNVFVKISKKDQHPFVTSQREAVSYLLRGEDCDPPAALISQFLIEPGSDAEVWGNEDLRKLVKK